MHAYHLNGKEIYTEGQPEIKIKLVKKKPSLKKGKENCEIIVLRKSIFFFEKLRKGILH